MTMSSTTLMRRNLGFALLASAIVMTSACEESPTEDEGEPQVAFIEIVSTVGTQTSTARIDNRTGIQIGTLTLRQNQANALTVRFLDETNAPEAVIASERADFELRADGLAPGIVFTAAGGSGASFNASVTPTAIGQGTFSVVLFHLGENHAELTRPLAYSVTP
jgi:hypothetical protein